MRERRSNERYTLLAVPLLAVPLLALLVVHPLMVHGCSCGHDFDFHLISWFEAATQIAHGNLHPHWAYTPAWDAGEPRFVFYPPLSWYLGAALGLALTHLPGAGESAGWSAVPLVFTWIALTLSGLTMFRVARRYAGAGAAVVAAAIYMANPYMLFTAFERTAYGELLAAAWMPLLLGGILRERVSIPRTAIPVALLWLSNAPAAVMGCYALAVVAIVRLTWAWRNRRRSDGAEHAGNAVRDGARIAGGAALGLGLGACYILPAAYERSYVQTAMATAGGMKINANFLFGHTGATPDDIMHDAVLRTASWIAVLLLAGAAVALFGAWRESRKQSGHAALPPAAGVRRLPIWPLAVLAAAAALLLTPLSAPVWRAMPEMAFLQFPWRLLALVAPVLALAIASALSGLRLFRQTSVKLVPSRVSVVAAAFIVAALGLPAWHIFHQPCDPEDTATARLAVYHSQAGTDPTDEYTPITADNDALSPNDPAWWLADTPDAAAPVAGDRDAHPADISHVTRTAPTQLTITAPHAQFLILNLRDYPAWRVTAADGDSAAQLALARAARADGLLAAQMPAGRWTIHVRYMPTLDQTAGDAISILSLAILGWLMRRGTEPATAAS